MSMARSGISSRKAAVISLFAIKGFSFSPTTREEGEREKKEMKLRIMKRERDREYREGEWKEHVKKESERRREK